MLICFVTSEAQAKKKGSFPRAQVLKLGSQTPLQLKKTRSKKNPIPSFGVGPKEPVRATRSDSELLKKKWRNNSSDRVFFFFRNILG